MLVTFMHISERHSRRVRLGWEYMRRRIRGSQQSVREQQRFQDVVWVKVLLDAYVERIDVQGSGGLESGG
jgi:hypothetical protein